MKNNGWTHRDSRMPRAADGGEYGKVYAWHAFQNAMIVRWREFRQNPFHVYWMRVPETWIDAADRKPTKADSDAQDCVLAKDRRGDIRVTGYHQFDVDGDLTQWQILPAPPSDYKALKKML
jgi:hypothetical protein